MAEGPSRKLILITVKTYPIPSKAYDELVCTAGVTETGDFIRLYPVNFRDLPYGRQFRKYQWIEVDVEKHSRKRDTRKESYRPDCKAMSLGEFIPTKDGDWSERARYVLPLKSQSIEELREKWKRGRASLGLVRPREVLDMKLSPDERQWKPSFLAELKQARIWEDRTRSRVPVRKVPFKFQYVFTCDDDRCKRPHRMLMEDWELGWLYWRMRDDGKTEAEAAESVRRRFFEDICAPRNDTHFFVGTVKDHPNTWIVLGAFYPKKAKPQTGALFDL